MTTPPEMTDSDKLTEILLLLRAQAARDTRIPRDSSVQALLSDTYAPRADWDWRIQLQNPEEIAGYFAVQGIVLYPLSTTVQDGMTRHRLGLVVDPSDAQQAQDRVRRTLGILLPPDTTVDLEQLAAPPA